MKRLLFTCSLMTVLSFTSSLAQTAKKPISRDGLVKAVNIFFDAVKADDYETIKNSYAADYTFIGPDGTIGGAEERMRRLKAQGGSNFVSATELTYRVYGDAAVVTGVATTKRPNGEAERSRFLQVWTMQGANLRLVASQVTKME